MVKEIYSKQHIFFFYGLSNGLMHKASLTTLDVCCNCSEHCRVERQTCG